MRTRPGVVASLAATTFVLCLSVPSHAQEEVQAASAAFAEGQQAQVRSDFVRAAELFEIADQAVPSPPALRSAIRNREAAGHDVRAATLSLRALERYGQDKETRQFVEQVLSRLAPKLGRVRVRCSEPCTPTADGALVGSGAATSTEFFLTPGAHTLRASWPGRTPLSRSVEAIAGQTLDVDFQAPPSAPPKPAPAAAAASASPRPATQKPGAVLAPSTELSHDTAGSGLSPAVFWVGAGLTAIAGGVTVWSGLDTLSANDDYERNPTRAGFEDGQGLERRTNILIAATAVLGTATLGVGLFGTDWGGSTDVAIRLGPSHASLALRGALP
jgi:hypothetical protein